MKTARFEMTAAVTPKAERSVTGGHPWIYDTEITSLSGSREPGGLVDVIGPKGAYLGTGFYSPHSKIRIRLVSRNANDRFDRTFWSRRLRYALDYRRAVMGEDFRCCRLVFGEADFLPGLTVDRFGPLLSAQVLSVGMERIKGMIFEELMAQLEQSGERIDGIFERNDVAIRELEGLPQEKGWHLLPGREPPASAVTEIEENGVRYLVDVENGQKTGFFLDQKYNRLAVKQLARGRRVLDCFTHTGSFGLNAALGGAQHVTAVDVSESAIAMARENARRNGLDEKMDFVAADVFELLPKLAQEHAKYDFVILDPPAFTKSRRTVDAALRGYREINLRAMKLLPRGGYLATCSCSHFMEDGLFRRMLREAAADAGVQLRQVEARQQGPDHPILWNVPETDYLKFYIFQVV
ncbi:class I SAM-dependent rRNA methyltransferase [Feifania hominis]|uniref:Class I SAM-dependent rRNA methyltransferase n=1 Tax=Feifania hominis TaxID=2763660 RepID=A0A926DD90_9FIRM|nr:class I SAM-dependent rRNA methyltransferase [Feifania hominis]MBC8536071.1 class I SAM-dependent rRNA methyltransferase [Feifania hominis]